MNIPDITWYGNGADDNVAMVAEWMASHGYKADEVAYMVSKPWKFDDEYRQAKAEADADPLAKADGHTADDAERSLSS